MDKLKIHTQYFNKARERLPGVSTIAKLIDDSGGLIHWAWDLGTQGLDYKKVRDQSGEKGTLAHYLIRCHLLKLEPDLGDYAPNLVEEAKKPLNSFLDYENKHRLKTKLSEKSLVSEKYKFGGTLDWYGQIDDYFAFVLMDWKSGKIYPSMRLQIAGYKLLLKDNGYPVDRPTLLKLDEQGNGFIIYDNFGDLSQEEKLFKLLLKAYPLKRKIWKK